MSNIFTSTENSKTSNPNRFRLYFTDKIDLRGNKKIALSDLSIHSVHDLSIDYIEISFTDQNGRPLQIDADITVSIIIKNQYG